MNQEEIQQLHQLIENQQKQIDELKQLLQQQQEQHQLEIKLLRQEMKEEIRKVNINMHQLETYFDDDIPKLENDQEYRNLIFDQLDFIGNISCSPEESWKNIYRHFFIRTNNTQFFDINKCGLLVGFQKWDDEKKPVKRIYPKQLLYY